MERLIGLGAIRADIGQGDVPWVVLADPDGNAFCVSEDRAVYSDTGWPRGEPAPSQWSPRIAVAPRI